MAAESPIGKLPRELRDAIYEAIVISEGNVRPKTLPFGAPRFTCSSGIILACKQLHAEFFQSFERTVLSNGNDIKIAMRLNDAKPSDMARLRTFINSLPQHDIDLMNARSKLKVKLLFSDVTHLADGQFEGWAAFCNVAGVKAQYVVDRECRNISIGHHIVLPASVVFEPTGELAKIYTAALEGCVSQLEQTKADQQRQVEESELAAEIRNLTAELEQSKTMGADWSTRAKLVQRLSTARKASRESRGGSRVAELEQMLADFNAMLVQARSLMSG